MFAGPLAPYSFQGITGKEYDPKSGLVNFGARWYDPAVGRFTQADTFKGFAFNPTTQHPYAYVGNNPINRVDPTGHAEFVRHVNLYIDDELARTNIELYSNGRTYFNYPDEPVKDLYEGWGYTVYWRDGAVWVYSPSNGDGGSNGGGYDPPPPPPEPTPEERRSDYNDAAGPVPNLEKVILTVPLYLQTFEQWSKEKLGFSKTADLYSYGCPLTSVAMVLSYYGIDTDPGRLNEELKKIQGFTKDTGYIIWDKAREVALKQGINLSYNEMKDKTTRKEFDEFIRNQINQGNPVILHVKTRTSQHGHYAVVTGYERDDTIDGGYKYYINDPAGRQTLLHRYDLGLQTYKIRVYQPIR